MIENIRKYTGLMIVVLVLLFVGLVFLGDNVGNTFAGKPVMEVAGRGVSQKEFQRNAIDVQKIAMEIPNRTPLPRETRILASHYLDEDIIENPYVLAGSILQQMGMFLQPSDGLPERFLANRLAVQKAGIEYGVTPSDNEVESFVENVLFADEDGNFNQEASREFFDETAGKLGIGTRGFNEYIRDLMTTQNLSKLIGGGIPPEMETVRALYDSAKQSISVKQISLDSATFEAEVNPTEEEIKAFYEENKDKYNSEEQRKISYVFVEPDWATKLDEVTAAKAEAAKKAEEERLKMEADKKLAEEAAARANEAKDSEEKPETPGSTDAPAPTDTTESSETSEEGPQGQTGEPGEPAPAEEPTAPAEEPTAPAEEPAAPAEEPAAPAEEPTAPAEEPAAPAEEPAAPAEEPTAPAEEPTAPAEEPAAPAEEPAAPVATISQEPKDKLNGAEKKEAVDALNPELTEFYQDIVDKMGADFEGLAAKHNFKVVTTELFTKEDAPELFKTLISNAAIGAIADAAFQLPEEADLDEKITPPYQTNDGWFVGRLEEIVKSVPLTYEQAKVRVTVDLKKKLARELMAKKAKELQEKLATAVKDGKSFEDVAKEEGHTASTLPDLKGGQSFQGRQFPAPPAFQAAQFTTPGEVAPVKLTPSEENPDRAIIVLVEKREVTKDEEYNTGLEGAFKGQSNITRYVAFQNWLYDRYNANDVKLFRSE